MAPTTNYLPLHAACVLHYPPHEHATSAQFSLDHKSGHARGGEEARTAWLFGDCLAKRRKPALSFHPPCVFIYCKTWVEPRGHPTQGP
jgi:hypothetical protein